MDSRSGDSREMEMVATVRFTFHHESDAITRVTGPSGDEWRSQMYPTIKTERDVLQHWATNAVANGVVDVCELDGWADLDAEIVTMQVLDVDRLD
jgi:hypothetical protein